MRVHSIVDLMARREITEAEQQRLDRYKQRRDEYIGELADSAAIAEPAGLMRDTEPPAPANATRWLFPGGLR
jgi:hypothetical protein